jgi:hypothetical protein
MKNPEYEELRETGWRRPLSAAEQAQLEAMFRENPEAKAESELTQMLGALPEAPPVATNFTAQVTQRVRRENVEELASGLQSLVRMIYRLRWVPRAAIVAAVFGLAIFAFEQHRHNDQRKQMAKSVAQIAPLIAAADPELMENFDTIRQLSDPPPQGKADLELLALMK